MARRFSAVISWRIWVPRIFSIELSAPGAPPLATAATTRRLVVRMLASSISTRARRAAKSGSSASGRPLRRWRAAMAFNRANAAVDCPTPAMLVRS